MLPQTLRRKEGIQLSYDIRQRIHATCVYPRRSSNGSSILIVGHETGLNVIWYGGRRFKTSSKVTNINGGGIDLTDDDEDSQSQTSQYEEASDEIDASRPFQDVLVHHDIPLGTGACRVTVPPLPTERTSLEFPSIHETHIVVAAACTDQTLRIVAIPLQPTTTLTDVQVVKLGTASMHQDLVADIAITLTADDAGDVDAEKRARSRSRGRVADSSRDIDASSKKWSLLIASISPTGNGLLLVHQLGLDSGVITTDPEDHMPAYRRFLRSPLTGCRIAFNPSPFPAERHSHLLIAIPDAPSVQVYDILPQVESSKRRRGSTTTVDSTSSTNRNVKHGALNSAKTLITLLPGFWDRPIEEDMPRRKRVLDAQWVMQGRAIIALMEDGEWGLWDLEAMGPASNKSNNLVKGQTNVSGIQGGALTKFALRGNVGSNVVATKRKSASQSRPSNESELAPMTPHTRKERSSGLFKTQESSNSTNVTIDQSKGSISVSRQEPSSGNQSKGYDESVILTYNAVNTLIPALQAYWRSETGGKGSFDSLGSGRLSTLPILYPTGEVPVASHLLPGLRTNTIVPSISPAFISATTSKLMLLVPSLTDLSSMPPASSNLPMRLMAAKSKSQDQTLLDSGELDVDGMDRILDKMANSSTEHSTTTNGFGRKSVGFLSTSKDDVTDDGDVDMGTPTLSKTSRSKLVVNKSGSEGRRLFT